MTGFITSDGADYLMGLFSGTEEVLSVYYVALVVTPVGTAEAGVELAEPPYGDYARSPINNGPENWVVAYGALTNLTEVIFASPGAEPWLGIVGWAICDASMEGRVLFAGDTDIFDVAVGDQVVMPIGTITLDVEMDSWRETT